MLEKNSYFDRFCINCGGRISDSRLKGELVCEKCLSSVDVSEISLGKINKENLIVKPLWYYFYDDIVLKKNIIELKNFFDEVENFIIFFEKLTNKTPWSLQITWAKRVITKQSFSIIAPTGVGKTTWGLVTGLYLWQEKKQSKIYYLLPTTLLTLHTFERFKSLVENFCKKTNYCSKDIYDRVVVYHGKLKAKEKKVVKEKIKNGDFDILFTTTNFLYRDFELLEDNIGKFKFIFVDDVDSLLKSAKNIDYVLKLLGFPQNIIELALELVILKIKLLTAKGSYFEKISQQIEELKKKIEEYKNKVDGTLVASSATAKPKGIKIKLLRELLNFEVGRSSTNIRNVEDIYIDGLDLSLSMDKNVRYNEIVNFYEKYLDSLIKIFKDGMLFFLSSDLGKDYVDYFVSWLENKGVKAVSYEKLDDEVVEKFRNGDIQALVGIASWRNPLARGIDLPDASKYAVFIGVPKFVFNVDILSNPRALISVILNLGKVLPDDLKKSFTWEEKIVSYLKFLNKVSNYSQDYIEKNNQLKEKLEEIYKYISDVLNDNRVKDILLNSEDIAFDGERFIVADVAAYIQASGRVSRMYIGGLTKGISLIFVDNKKSFNNLQKRIKWFYEDIEFKKLEL